MITDRVPSTPLAGWTVGLLIVMVVLAACSSGDGAELEPIADQSGLFAVSVPSGWSVDLDGPDPEGGLAFGAAPDQTAFELGDGPGLLMFTQVEPVEATVEGVLAFVTAVTPLDRCPAPTERELTLPDGQAALRIGCDDTVRATVVVVGDDAGAPDAVAIVRTSVDDPAHDDIVESMVFDFGAVPTFVATDDTGRLSVDLPFGWSWDGTSAQNGAPFIGAADGPLPEGVLVAPLLQMFVLDAEQTGSALDPLLEALLGDFGFDQCAESLTRDDHTVGTLVGVRVTGRGCGAKGLTATGFVGLGADDAGAGEVLFFVMTAGAEAPISPQVTLDTVDLQP